MESIRELFKRKNILRDAGHLADNEVISVHHCLENHLGGASGSLRVALKTLRVRNDGDARAPGRIQKCRIPDQAKPHIKKVREFVRVLPEWVPVDEKNETRTVEGVLVRTRISNEDFPLQPWHTYYDWLFYVRPDPQYEYLLSEAKEEGEDDLEMECEWDSHYLPVWAWPRTGSRILLRGRWIYDCGHPDKSVYRCEIHPPKLVVSFRMAAEALPGSAVPVRTHQAIVFIGKHGGYIEQTINDEDYYFDLVLPPRPDDSHVVAWKFHSMTALAFSPTVALVPDSKAPMLRVCIPFAGKASSTAEYGVIVSAGWIRQGGTPKADPKIRKVEVWLKSLHVKNKHEGSLKVGKGEWHLYVGIHGSWTNFGLSVKDDQTVDLNLKRTFLLHQEDRISITSCGFEADLLHNFIGDKNKVGKGGVTDWSYATWQDIVSLGDGDLYWVIDHMRTQLTLSFKDQNEQLGYYNAEHVVADSLGQQFTIETGDYRLAYAIAAVE